MEKHFFLQNYQVFCIAITILSNTLLILLCYDAPWNGLAYPAAAEQNKLDCFSLPVKLIDSEQGWSLPEIRYFDIFSLLVKAAVAGIEPLTLGSGCWGEPSTTVLSSPREGSLPGPNKRSSLFYQAVSFFHSNDTWRVSESEREITLKLFGPSLQL